jgi:hypothetical protein
VTVPGTAAYLAVQDGSYFSLEAPVRFARGLPRP